ncbi:hypothetical protein D8O27_11525 [Burkholderia mallei]|uniref:Uncharacterized protein n=2 Tax=Burkholderia mallei TaxID=13373 RepID=A0AAX1XAI7_BURML|nr:hypothetical protein BMAA0136 [Burkholderia mallei ATCC 23344]EEP84495.1 conserved hypothetical protein [Burkholderia mallei GB8 horse 4]KAA8765155.1 hypothetical protein F5D26_24280 [Burkholderia pseudomallei]RKN98634.1 hypothetical protein D8O31_11905 [Burkholderia mallei]MBM5666070.1 hypothetical protein [Burkholderia pseudomallei]
MRARRSHGAGIRLGFDKPSGTHSSPHDGWVQTDIAMRLPQISLMPDQALANE